MNIRDLTLSAFLAVAVLLLPTWLMTHAASGGVFFVYHAADSAQIHTAGSPVLVHLVAKDSNGTVIRDWNTSGRHITLLLRNSTADSDTSLRSWNDDAEGFSWVRLYNGSTLLTPASSNMWILPPSAFTDGMLELTLIHTKAEEKVHFELQPLGSSPKQISVRMSFISGPVTNYLVSITLADLMGSAVYVLRPYELIVAARDRWLNVSNEEVLTHISARWPGEFGGPGSGTAGIFEGAVFIKGYTSYLLTSRTQRVAPDELQRIIVYAADNSLAYGESNPYEVRPHAPSPFALLGPRHNAELRLQSPMHVDYFIWSRPEPPDPYTNIRISAGDTILHSDEIRYTWVLVDAESLTRAKRFSSNNDGTEPRIMFTHSALSGIVLDFCSTCKEYEFVWFVEANDDLYTTLSTPMPGHRIDITQFANGRTAGAAPTPTELALEQNYPNPFNPLTTIRYSIPKHDHMRLSIRNLLGEEIRVLLDAEIAPGVYELSFDASGLGSGVYVYTLETGGASISKRMVFAK
jgi:hypothetical protein